MMHKCTTFARGICVALSSVVAFIPLCDLPPDFVDVVFEDLFRRGDRHDT